MASIRVEFYSHSEFELNNIEGVKNHINTQKDNVNLQSFYIHAKNEYIAKRKVHEIVKGIKITKPSKVDKSISNIHENGSFNIVKVFVDGTVFVKTKEFML